MKPEYTDAAKTLKDEEVSAINGLYCSYTFWFWVQKYCTQSFVHNLVMSPREEMQMLLVISI